MQAAEDIARVLYILKTIFVKLFRSELRILLHWYQHVQMLQLGDRQFRIDFTIEFEIWCDDDINWPLRTLWKSKAHLILNGKASMKSF